MLDRIRALPQGVRILIACVFCVLIAALVIGVIQLLQA